MKYIQMLFGAVPYKNHLWFPKDTFIGKFFRKTYFKDTLHNVTVPYPLKVVPITKPVGWYACKLRSIWDSHLQCT